jgi:ribosomal protein S18 acetylase RimI-like enzyme
MKMELKQYNVNMPDEIFEGVQVVHQLVFDGALLKREKLQRKNLLALVALEDGVVTGFKFGYEQENGVFYSWLGGVHPEYQRRGIAKALMTHQHELVKALGYSVIRTYSRNEKMAMLILNLQSGFQIKSTFIDDKGWHKIVLEKML